MRVRQDGPSGLPFGASAPPPIAVPPPPAQRPFSSLPPSLPPPPPPAQRLLSSLPLPPPPEQSASLPSKKGKEPLFLPRGSNSPPSDSQAKTCFKIRIPGMNDRKARLGDLGFSSEDLEKDELVEEKDELNEEQDVPMPNATLSLPSEVSNGCR